MEILHEGPKRRSIFNGIFIERCRHFFLHPFTSAHHLGNGALAATLRTDKDIKPIKFNIRVFNRPKILNDKMVSEGKMSYQQPSALRWEYTSPYTYTFILNDNKILLKNNRRSDVIDVNQNKMFKEIARIMMNSIVGKCLTDDKAFKTTIAETPAEWVATLLPQKKDMKQMWTKLILHFDRKQNAVVKVEMFEKSGDFTVIDLKNAKTNKPIDKKVFAV